MRVGADELKQAHAAYWDLSLYAQYVHGYVPARHHQVWLDMVQDELERETDEVRFLVFDAPPGHAKSSYLSEVLPAWFLGRWPHESVLHYTSADNLAGLYHAAVDDTLKGESPRGERHALVFGGDGCRQGDVWNFEKGLKLKGAREKVSYKMSGYGSATLGLRGKLNILDDPLTEDKVTSEVELAKAKRYFRRTVWTRKKPGALFVVVATRWGYDDLTAYIVENFPNVKVIHMPALGHWQEDGTRVGDVETGEALWPEYISKEQLMLELYGAADNDGMALEDFLTIFQGEPGAAEGNQLQPEKVKMLPVGARALCKSVVQYWDLAFTQKTRSDWCVCATLGTDGANLFLLDLYRARMNEHEFELALEVQFGTWGPSVVGIEKTAAVEWLVQSLENRSLLPIQGVGVGIQSKEQRANILASKLQQGRFYADKTAKWWPTVASEWRQFPKGKKDDTVDGCSGAAHMLLGQQMGLVKTSQYLRVGTESGHHESRWMQWRRAHKRIAVPKGAY